MCNRTPWRRSRRIQLQGSKHNHSTTKANYLRTWLQNSTSPNVSTKTDIDALENQLEKEHIKSQTRRLTRYLPAESAFESEDSDDSNANMGPSDGGETTNLSNDSIEWSAAGAKCRQYSYDSRCDAISEITIVPEDARAGEHGCQSSRRSSSKLFYSDPGDFLAPVGFSPSPSWGSSRLSPTLFSQPLVTGATEDVIEEVMDAITLFSRRCNRHKVPLTMRFSEAALADEEVGEALEHALRLGLGRKLSLTDGSKIWTIGPKS